MILNIEWFYYDCSPDQMRYNTTVLSLFSLHNESKKLSIYLSNDYDSLLLLILFHVESNHLWFWYFQLILVLMLRDETNVDELLNTILGYWIKITISSSWILINWLPKLKIEMKQIEIPLSSSNKVHLVKHFNNQLLIHSNSYLDILKCYINYESVM